MRPAVAAGTVGALLIAAAAGGYATLRHGSAPRPDAAPSYSLATVARRTLTISTTMTGTLGYASTSPIPFRAAGTVTWLPPSGSTITQGEVLLRVNDKPVVLMYGPTPAYRTIAAAATAQSQSDRYGDGSHSGRGHPAKANRANSAAPTSNPGPVQPTTGPDVEELEENLAALGYSGFSIDSVFTSHTETAVRAWQEHLGVPATGRVDLGSVVFLPGPIRAVTNPDALGGTDPSSAIKATSLAKVVTAAVPQNVAGWAKVGARVQVTLPNQRTAAGTVIDVDPPHPQGQGLVVPIRVHLTKPTNQSGDVFVTRVTRRAKSALTVPVTALVALAEGGYSLQRQDGSYVAVKPGLYADGMVQVSGDIKPGMKVRDAP